MGGRRRHDDEAAAVTQDDITPPVPTPSRETIMIRPRLAATAALLALATLNQASHAQQTFTYADLINRMTDPSHLAVLPAKGETCAQWSSYDRASRYDEATKTYVHWDANGDGGGVIRHEGDRVVMAEMKGPGCIWRTWSALAESGHVKIYLDDQPEPAVDLPFSAYFDGKHPPFAYPALSYDLAKVGCRGQNMYMPIPYQKSCKVVADKGWGNYFHFNYMTYPAGTVLPTFSAELAAQHAEQLTAVDTFLAKKLGTDPAGDRPGAKRLTGGISVAPGATACIARFDGPLAITELRVKAAFASRDDEMAALRRVALRITWDGQSRPAVWCPLGDFFGTAPGVNPYRTLMTGMTNEGFYSLWYMPFAKSAVVELVNEDQKERTFEYEVDVAPLGRPFDGLGHFHAKWHRDLAPLPADRWPDWTTLQTQGRGRFCGLMLHVWNPRGGWWGEGDEKFFVDGEKFPSTIGTGSEDYFGYAWGNPHLFQKPYHAQTMTQQNRGHQSLLRWHFLDNVPFQTSFESVLEKYYKSDRGTLFATTVMWYLAPDGVDPYDAVPVSQRDGYYTKPDLFVAGLKVLNEPRGEVQVQKLPGNDGKKWKNDEQLWWVGGRPKDRLVLALPVAKAGKHEVIVHLTKAHDYGIVKLALDGKAGEPIDLYNPDVVPSGPISLGTFDLAEGPHMLTVEIVGANPQAVKSYMFGIDRIELKPVP
jgi:hypothetical protein